MVPRAIITLDGDDNEGCAAGVVHKDTLYLVGNLQSPDASETPVLPTVIVMCYYHFPSQKWTRLRLRHAPEVCHYPLLASYDDHLILFGGKHSHMGLREITNVFKYPTSDHLPCIVAEVFCQL